MKAMYKRYHPDYGLPDSYRVRALDLARMTSVGYASKRLKVSAASIYRWRKDMERGRV